MIVFDENVHQQRIMSTVAAWYRGRVVSITALRPGTIIGDDAIPALLRQVKQPTFVTTNVPDFWRRVPAHSRYAIVCMVLSNERLYEIPHLLRRLFSLPEFKTKARRMGKVVRVSRRQIQSYGHQCRPHIQQRMVGLNKANAKGGQWEDDYMAHEVLEEERIAALLKAVSHLVMLPKRYMWVDYDQAADVVYIHFEAEAASTHSEMRDAGIILDYRGSRLVGLTILEASRR